jgi:hypothetical protein
MFPNPWIHLVLAGMTRRFQNISGQFQPEGNDLKAWQAHDRLALLLRKW